MALDELLNIASRDCWILIVATILLLSRGGAYVMVEKSREFDCRTLALLAPIAMIIGGVISW